MEVVSYEPPDANSHKTRGPSKKSSSLSSKVTSVLSTSFSDTEFREALSLFDQRNLLNNAKTRRQIRLELQRDVMECNGLVIDHFGRVAEQLNHVKTVLGKLNTKYEDMKSQVVMAQDKTSSTVHETTSLLKKRELLRNRQSILVAFKDRFIMTEAEIISLTSTAEPLDNRFFTALCKAKSIIKSCEVLLGLENQTFGLDLMEQAYKNLNMGFQKLYNWTQREFKTLNIENPQMSSSIRQALRILAERPSLFQSCLDLFSEARERILSEAFHVALTGISSFGDVDDTVKPIDLTAHDTLRYVGDMLAWVHTTAVSEREALEILFIAEGEELVKGLRSGRDTEVWRLVADDGGLESEFNPLKALGNLVDKDVSGTARLLRQRVEQIIQTNEEIVPAYKIATLLSFYRITFDRLLGSSTNLLGCVQNLEAEALRQFRSLIKDSIASVQIESQNVPADLTPPRFFVDALEQLRAIMQTYDSSLSPPEKRDSDFDVVLSDAFEPFLSACENMATVLTPLKGSIFAINFNALAEKCLDAFDFTKKRAGRLRRRVKAEVVKVVKSQYEFFHLESGLEPALIKRIDGITTVKTDASRHALSAASQRLDEFLPSALIDANDRIRYIQDALLARQITAEAAEMFCRDFEKLERELRKEETNSTLDQERLHSVFPRTSADIRVLLS
ncbi:hypothetical protein C2857_003067 [Epichloe festucae Fl1]|uniref:Conserved oligomeric Golgi complex subunit 6 n=1 Tax=Epichloe festucae (strain Fl1) TaxID=877507 RepID=A0A7S9KK68_EPIFF|nr:hypothetical protein C2857_003067 [Epichloe festucae Fl1]